MNAHTVVKSPIITEKSTDLTGKYNKYSFVVDERANKIEVRKAIEDLFKVKVVKVNTVRMRGKQRRVRFHQGKTPDWKKAIVTLKAGDKIDLA
ncbi:MAG: 50S ribosomal protein L23 [Nitrospirae bacterium]|nr:50S ribosomal protein L23 [Nitrospirota bacterium]